jgi:hypothetical protein
MYLQDDLTHRTKRELIEVIRHTHQALVALLWQIDDLKNFDDLMYESHFEDTVPFDRAQYVHRVLMTRCVDDIVSGGWLIDADCGDSFGYSEFVRFVKRCDISRSFDGADKLFADIDNPTDTEGGA